MSGAGSYNLFGQPGAQRNLSGLPFTLPLAPVLQSPESIAGAPSGAYTLANYWPAAQAMFLPPGLVGATASATAAGSSATTLTLQLGRGSHFTAIGTVVFASGSTTGVITGQTSFATLPQSVAAPSMQGATLLIGGDELVLSGTLASGLTGAMLYLPMTFV